MDTFIELVDFIDLNIKDKVKEGNYLKLMSLVMIIAKERNLQIEKIKDDLEYDSDDPYGDNDIYNSYWYS